MLGASKRSRPEQSAVKIALPRHAVYEHLQGEHSSFASVDTDKSSGIMQREINRHKVIFPFTLNTNRKKLVLRGYDKHSVYKTKL